MSRATCAASFGNSSAAPHGEDEREELVSEGLVIACKIEKSLPPGESLREALARSLPHRLLDYLRSTSERVFYRNTRAGIASTYPAPVEWVQQTDRREDGEGARERDRAESRIALQALSGPSQLWNRITLRQLFPASPVGRGVPTATSIVSGPHRSKPKWSPSSSPTRLTLTIDRAAVQRTSTARLGTSRAGFGSQPQRERLVEARFCFGLAEAFRSNSQASHPQFASLVKWTIRGCSPSVRLGKSVAKSVSSPEL